MRLKTNSVRLRLTLWHVAVLATIIIGFALGTYIFVRKSLLRQIDNHLERDLATVQRVAQRDTEELATLAHHGNVALFRVTDSGRTTLAATERWNRSGLGDIKFAGTPGASQRITAADGEHYRTRSVTQDTAGKSLLIAVAHEEQAVSQSLRSLAMILLLGIPAALLLAVAGGYFLAGRALSPIGAMVAKAREITAECLSERLPVENPNDEFG